MQIANVAVEIDHCLPIEPEYNAQHTMRRGMLRPHVQHHLRAFEQGVLSCRYLYLMHTFLGRSWFRWFGQITTCYAPRLDHKSDLCRFAAVANLRELQNNCLRCAGFIPNVPWLQSFSQDKTRHLRRLRRFKDFRFILSGNLFGGHRLISNFQLPISDSLSVPKIGNWQLAIGNYLSFGITSLPPWKISRISRSSGTDRNSKP